MRFLQSFLALVLIGVAVAEPLWFNSSDGRHFLIEGEPKYNWFKASHECSRRNLQLVEIQSESKNQALVELLRSVFGKSVSLWLGANDQFNKKLDTKRPFYWSSSGKPMTFSFWQAGEPNNERNQEHCVQTFAGNPDFKWNDVSCRYQYGFICEEQHSHTENSAAMNGRRERIMRTTKKLFDTQQQEQQKFLERARSSRSLIEKNNNEIERFLRDIRTKLSHEENRGAPQHNREVRKFSTEANQMISQLNEELRESTQATYAKLSQQFDQVQQAIQDILENADM